MKTKTVRRIIMIVIIAAFVAAAAILIVRNARLWTELHTDNVRLKMPANGSAGDFYEYSLSRGDVLREVDRYQERFFLNFGPGHTDVWEFEIVGEGELTVSRTEFQGGSEIGGFDEVYLVEAGKCVKQNVII